MALSILLEFDPDLDVDSGVLDYLLDTLNDKNTGLEEKEDLFFGILPSLSGLDFGTTLPKLFKRLCSAGRDGVAVPETAPSTSTAGKTEDEDSSSVLFTDLMALLTELDIVDHALDEDVLSYLLEIFQSSSTDDSDESSEQIEILHQYIPGLVYHNESEQVTLKVLHLISTYIEKKEEEEDLVNKTKHQENADSLVFQLANITSNVKEERQLTEEEKAEKKKLLERGIDKVAVNPRYDKKGKDNSQKASNMVIFVENENVTKSKVRYRDGEIVAHKGEKFLVEKEKEYDSGCRGRVKTKGKRGPGAGKGL